MPLQCPNPKQIDQAPIRALVPSIFHYRINTTNSRIERRLEVTLESGQLVTPRQD
jgi:hypothetical protein